MYLNYTKIKSGTMGQPRLRLQTLAGKNLGVVPFVNNLHFAINYSDVSTIEFSVPYIVDGMINPMYSLLTSYKVIYTEALGIYILSSPTKSGDGVMESKQVSGYSLEQVFQSKNLFLQEGTYNFWNPADKENTILGRIVELDPSWHVGYVAPRLIGCYRTFDEYDSDALSFCYNDAMEKYRCAFVFDVYKKSINVYDADEKAESLPIYLSYKNLVESVEVSESIDEFATKLHLHGADDLTIRDVNPIGTDYIINLDFFLNNGDLDVKVGSSTLTLADRVRNWQASIAAKQSYYTGLISARSSFTAQKLAFQAKLTDLNGELDGLTAKQSVTIQALALEKTAAGKSSQQAALNDINRQIDAKKSEIAVQEQSISDMDTEIAKYNSLIQAVNNELAYEKYFTADERKVLAPYLIESSLEEETFVATDIDTTTSGALSTVTGEVSVSGATISKIELTDLSKTMYSIAGGKLKIKSAGISAEIVRGTLEVSGGTRYVFTGYLGSTTYGSHNFPSGLITLSGAFYRFTSDVAAHTEHEITEYVGTYFNFQTTDAASYFTVSSNDYQRYSVAMELYNFGDEALDDLAWPIYEFSIGSANFLYHEKFEPFKNKLELGKAVHLELGSDGRIEPKVIGFELNFEDISSFSLIFSNRFQRKSKTFQLIEELRNASKSSRSFDANKYLYNRVADKSTQVDAFMKGQLNAAVNNIINKENQTVLINGSGIHVGGDSNYQMRIVDNMICMTDDGWKTAKLAIGLFASEETGTQWGVNAEMIAGKLIIGNNMVLQNPTDDGFMMFQVDSTGAWLYNSRFVLQDGNQGGLMIIDPKYGIVAGTKLLFDTNGTTVTPEFMDELGDITYDGDGMPKNANFFLDINTGNAYFRGKLIAKSGKIGGFTIADSYLYSGSGTSRAAINGGSDYYSAYAFWCGANDPAAAPFWVKKNGEMSATKATITGTLKASKIEGNLVSDPDKGGWLVGCGIAVGNVKYNAAGVPTGANFFVDSKGNVNMVGNITWGTNSSPVRVLYARSWTSTPVNEYTNYPSSSISGWHRTLNVAYDYYISYSYDGGKTWTSAMVLQGRDGEDGLDGADGSDANVTRGNIAKALYERSGDYYTDGIYSYKVGSKYYLAINASYILAGEIDADEIALTCSYGGFCKGRGSDGVRTTYGAMMYGSNGAGSEPYIIVTNAGARMSAPNDKDLFVTGSGVYSSDEISVGSDRRLKYAIEYNMKKYEKFFSLLKPTQYKLKNGQSGRYHTGFIAQDVEDALEYSGLTNKDFAGLTILPVQEVNPKDGIDDEVYRLRYGEFISLNTYMIQKLMREVAELKEQIQKLS